MRRALMAALRIAETSPWDPALAAFFSSTAATREHLLLAHDAASGALIGFCEGATHRGGVYCSRLAIAKASRCAGVGRALLAALFAEARRQSPPACVAWLCTLDYQAPLYYPKVGFTKHHELAGLRDGRVSTYFYRAIDDCAAWSYRGWRSRFEGCWLSSAVSECAAKPEAKAWFGARLINAPPVESAESARARVVQAFGQCYAEQG